MNGQRAVGLIAGAVLAAMLVTTAAVAASEPLRGELVASARGDSGDGGALPGDGGALRGVA